MLVILILATLVGIVFAQTSTSSAAGTGATVAPLPQCAQICLGNALAQEGVCSSIDARCLCQNMNYDSALSCCIYQNCDAADQQTSLAFNVHECNAFNVSIPNTIGCANNATSSTANGAISVETTAVATFKGGKLFTGTCTSAQFASATLDSGRTLEYPWVGCSNADPACCPFDPKVGGALSVCPADYVTTQGACCPSGWSVYSSAIAGETPCFTTTSHPLTVPTNVSSPGADASVITSQLFSLKYTLAPHSSSKFPTGAIAGIAVGAAVVIGLVIAATMIFLRKRRAKAHEEREAATVKSPTANTPPLGTPITELPSPGIRSPADDRQALARAWTNNTQSPITPVTPAQPLGGAELPAVETPEKPPPVELTGDMYLNEHHPANSPPASPQMREIHDTHDVAAADAVHNPQRNTIGSIETFESEEASPIYSPVGGSALLPDSPHLNSRMRPSGEGRSRPTSQEFPDSPRQGSVKEIVDELEKGRKR